jgi:hypothetical protein
MDVGSTTSVADSRSALTHWLVPSVSDLLFVALLGLLAFTTLSVRLLGDAGIGWHIRTGQLIMATHTIPHTDPFSSSMSGQPWFAWEWLYDALVGWLETFTGLNGVVAFTALIIAAVFTCTFRLMLLRGSNILMALILTLLAASASMIHFLARPHVVSWLFTVAWFRILEISQNDFDGSTPDFLVSPRRHSRHWLIYLLPVMMLLWVNIHGGFLIGFALLGIYWLSATWVWFRLAGRITENGFQDVLDKIRIKRRVLDLTGAGVLSGLATLANPYGWRLHLHIYRYLSNRFLMDHIDEFQSPNFHYVAQKCFAIVLLLTLLALVVKGPAIGGSQGLVPLFAVFSGLYASRNIPTSSLLLVLLIGPWLSQALQKLRLRNQKIGITPENFFQRMKAVELSLRGHLWSAAAILLTFWIVAHGGNLGSRQWMDAHFNPQKFPAAAVDFIQRQNADGNIASPDYWGGYLIYRLYPRMKVVIDDRHDFYGDKFLSTYLRMVHVEPGWEEFLRQHPASFLVVPKDSALSNILAETASWHAIYTDDVATVFSPSKLP